MKKQVLLLICSFIFTSFFAQTSQDVLLTIDGRDISSEEFLRVYNKNNSITPAEEKKEMNEYLDLFINYKLKVIEAENLGYDTSKAFLDEFNRYKEQLAKPYLEKSEIKEELIIEAYERSTEEIHASHILIRSKAGDLPADTLNAFNKASEIRARIVGGEPFEEVARATSDDGSVKDNGGDLGYFTAFKMVYPFETAAYNTKVGEVSEIVRTSYGYHIIKVHDRRANRGSIKVAHIMTRIPKDASEPEIQASKQKIDKAYLELMNGAEWGEVVNTYSENPRTKSNNGEIGLIGTGKAPEEFLDACFKLEEGSFSKPIKVDYGYHIAKVIEFVPLENFENSRDNIVRRVEKDKNRKVTIKDFQVSMLEKKYNVEIFRDNIQELANKIDTSIYSGNWKAQDVKHLLAPVFVIDSNEYSQFDFAQYLENNKIISKASIPEYVNYFFPTYYSEELTKYAKQKLPEEYPEYRYLLQEYHDGILLFNLTNEVVWEKAQTDTTGLESFYKKSKKYQWNPRITVNIYTYTNNSFTSELPELVKKQQKKKLGNQFLTDNLCPNDTVPCFNLETKTFEKGHDSMADKLTWEKGSFINESDENTNYLYYVVNTKGKEDKKLQEARGLYMADYQSFLEEEWINELREKYTITLNEELFETLVSDQTSK